MAVFNRILSLICLTAILASGIPSTRANAQETHAKPFSYTDAIDAIRATGYEGPLQNHPAIVTHVKQEAGPKLEPLITQLRENIKVEVKFEYGAGNQTVVFKPYRAKNFVLHTMGANANFPMMDGFLTLGQTLDILDIPDLRNTIVKISLPRDDDGQTPDVTVRVGYTDTAVKLLVSEDIYTSETYYIEGLSFEELVTVQLGDETLDAKSLFTF